MIVVMYGIEPLVHAIYLLATGFVVMLACRYIRISPIVGFLIAGVVIGPYGWGLLEDSDTIKLLAKLGVVFLLFDIGLHFSFKSAWTLRRDLFGLAPMQVLLCSVIFSAITYFIFGANANVALIIGVSLALSSTAVVVQILADLRQSGSPLGNTAKAVLVFQDIAAVFLLIFAATVNEGGNLGAELYDAVMKTFFAVAAVMVIGHFLLAPLMKSMARFNDPELFTLFGLLIVLVTAVATEQAGLSLTLGAFLAGMVMGETPYRVLLQTELRPFRSLLLALFFVTVGAMLNPVALAGEAGTILLMMVVLITVKVAVFALVLKLYGRAPHQIVELTFLLAQGSEFAFVVLGMPVITQAVQAELLSQLIAAIALSMLATPFLMIAARRWSVDLCRKLEDTVCNSERQTLVGAKFKPVFIVGMNDVGRTIARALRTHDIPYIAVERDRERFLDATAAGYTVAYGEASDLRFWKALGVDMAQAMVLATPRYEISVQLNPIVNKLYPDMPRYAAVQDTAEAKRYAELGVLTYTANGVPRGLEIAVALLTDFGISEERIQDWMDDEHAATIEALAPVAIEDAEAAVEAEAA